MDKNSKKIKSFEPKTFYINYSNDILTVSKEPIGGKYPDFGFTEEFILFHKKLYIHSLNKFAYDKDLIPADIFRKAEIIIDKIKEEVQSNGTK